MTFLNRLAGTVSSRRGGDPAASYTASLLARGPAKVAEKFGEEAVELVIAAVSEEEAAVTAEAADVLYHLLVLLAARDVPLDAVLAELERREGVSGHEEKAGR